MRQFSDNVLDSLIQEIDPARMTSRSPAGIPSSSGQLMAVSKRSEPIVGVKVYTSFSLSSGMNITAADRPTPPAGEFPACAFP